MMPPKQKNIRSVTRLIDKQRTSVFSRFPLLFTLLTTFGFVATLYGFERIIDQIDILSSSPYILLTVGLATLALTGSLYKKLRGS